MFEVAPDATRARPVAGIFDRAWVAGLVVGYGRLGGMSTPSERIFAQLEEGDGTELCDVLPPRARHPVTLAHTADRIMGGVALREAVADFVDDLRLRQGRR